MTLANKPIFQILIFLSRPFCYCFFHYLLTQVNIIANQQLVADGLACDWLTQKLYWTHAEAHRIEVVTLDKYYRKVLFWEDIDEVRAIALVPMERSVILYPSLLIFNSRLICL